MIAHAQELSATSSAASAPLWPPQPHPDPVRRARAGAIRKVLIEAVRALGAKRVAFEVAKITGQCRRETVSRWVNDGSSRTEGRVAPRDPTPAYQVALIEALGNLGFAVPDVTRVTRAPAKGRA